MFLGFLKSNKASFKNLPPFQRHPIIKGKGKPCAFSTLQTDHPMPIDKNHLLTAALFSWDEYL